MQENPYKAPESNISNEEAKVAGAFHSLFDLGYKRSVRQAIAFYFTYFVGFLCMGFLIGFITSDVFGGSTQATYFVGAIAAVIACTGLAMSICVKKSILKSFKSVGLIILTLVSSVILGALLGLIPIAYLTTRDKET